jgi:predicted enzyme related to lactoylglutathione lyase
MKRLSGLRLRVADPAGLARFYERCFGMEAQQLPQGWRVGYAGQDADLILLPGGAPYVHQQTHRYWKIGVTLPNVDIAVAQLRGAGIAVSDPKQFLDIGYMAHLTDPEGFMIELLQHDFEGRRPQDAGNPNMPLGGGAHVGQIPLRTGEVEAELQRFATMQRLSIQDVPQVGFDLHFLAYTDEDLPNPDVNAVDNREWLWKRPYTTLEFQQIPGADIRPTPAFQGLEITG